MKCKFLLALASVGTLAFNAGAQWAPKQSMTVPSGSTGISGVQCFTLNGKVYAGGGYFAMFANTNDFYMYDPSTNQWTPKADIPGGTSRSAGISFTYNGKGYVGLGAKDWSSTSPVLLSDLWMYDPALDQWTQKASLPDTGRTEAGYFMANNKVYVVGGGVTFGGFTTNDVWEYDPATDQWAAKNAYPLGAISGSFAWGSGAKGYISCGYIGYYTRKTMEYSPGNDSWTPRDSFPGAAGNDGVAFVLNGKGYCGLSRQGSTYSTDFYAYDMTANTWGPAIAFPHGGRANAMATVVNSKAYVGTGWKPASSTVYFKDWYEYPTIVGVEEFGALSSAFDVYPNPGNGIFMIDAPEGSIYELISITGQKMKSGDVSKGGNIDARDVANGTYVLRVTSDEKTATKLLQIAQ